MQAQVAVDLAPAKRTTAFAGPRANPNALEEDAVAAQRVLSSPKELLTCGRKDSRMPGSDHEITDLLRLVGQRDREGLDQLVELLYTTLWRMCRSRLGRLPANSLTPTALLNELYIDLAKRHPDLTDRHRFFGYAHKAIKHLAISSIRRSDAQKRGGGKERVDLEKVDIPDKSPGQELVEVFEVLARVEEQDPDLAAIIKLRVFEGRSERETAEVLGITRKRVQTQWITARGLLTSLLGIERRT